VTNSRPAFPPRRTDRDRQHGTERYSPAVTPPTQMTQKISYNDIRAQLDDLPATLRRLLGGVSAEALTFQEEPGTWTAIEVLGHLADGELHDWMPRVGIIMSTAGDKRFTPFDRERGLPRYPAGGIVGALDDFELLRRESLIALDTLQIQDADLDREGLHPTFGPVTLRQLLACWITHDYAHVAQISRLLTRYYGQHVGPWTAFFSLLKDR
jgi:hypothetical protein